MPAQLPARKRAEEPYEPLPPPLGAQFTAVREQVAIEFPGVVRELHEATAALPDAARARILGENARAIYHLPAGG